MFDYERKQAPHEKNIIRDCLKNNKPYPKAIANAPELELDNSFYYFAFFHLDTCRAFELGPISYSAIRDYARQFELDADQEERFIEVIRQCDEWLRGELRKDIANANANN